MCCTIFFSNLKKSNILKEIKDIMLLSIRIMVVALIFKVVKYIKMNVFVIYFEVSIGKSFIKRGIF